MRRFLVLALAGLALLGLSGTALALGTAAGTSVNNLASVTFNVGGQVQPAVAGSVQFVVDNRVDLTAAANDAPPVYTAVGLTDQLLTFIVSNTGNAVQDYDLTAVADLPAYFGNVRIFADNNDSGALDAGDTLDYVDELAADGSRLVFIVADIIGQPADSTDVVVTLTATTADGGTAATQGGNTAETAGPNTAGVDVVFGDGAGVIDAVEDAIYTAANTVRIRNAALTVTKTVVVIDDPFNGTTDPKAIPGATLEYTISVENTGGAAALGAVLTDNIPAGTTFVAGSATLNGGAIADAAAGVLTVNLTSPLVSGATDTVVFQVTVTYP